MAQWTLHNHSLRGESDSGYVGRADRFPWDSKVRLLRSAHARSAEHPHRTARRRPSEITRPDDRQLLLGTRFAGRVLRHCRSDHPGREHHRSKQREELRNRHRSAPGPGRRIFPTRRWRRSAASRIGRLEVGRTEAFRASLLRAESFLFMPFVGSQPVDDCRYLGAIPAPPRVSPGRQLLPPYNGRSTRSGQSGE